ncbi:MAG: XTP/dITP diphosphatase [Acholeplasmatales bacterium]|nr:XTP/dITP diphosphatase [Acholeplasmatales bacterium]
MKTVVIATNNKNKVREFKSILDNPNLEFKTLKEIGYDKEIEENGNTFEENAIIKAMTVAKDLNVIAISDDSGLCVDALNGAPGIYSARYAGTHNDEDNNALLIKNLNGIENRNAHYECAICIAYPNGDYITEIGTVSGIIIDDRRGNGGFGYDPYFYIPEFGKTFAEVPLEKKNTISHRNKALMKIKDRIDENFNIIR